jgi:hypothetical protein
MVRIWLRHSLGYLLILSIPLEWIIRCNNLIRCNRLIWMKPLTTKVGNVSLWLLQPLGIWTYIILLDLIVRKVHSVQQMALSVTKFQFFTPATRIHAKNLTSIEPSPFTRPRITAWLFWPRKDYPQFSPGGRKSCHRWMRTPIELSFVLDDVFTVSLSRRAFIWRNGLEIHIQESDMSDI